MGKWFQDKSFSTEKREQGIKARKGHCGINARKAHRALGILLAAALVFQTVPFEGIAVSASESSGGGQCTHHTEHTPDCGYIEAEPGHECTHEHTEDCYRTVEGEDGSTTKELDCHHEHDESCGYREETEGSPCTFVCEICKGGTDEVPEDNTDDNGITDGDSENPGTENGDEIEEPGDGQEECICKELCTEDSINTDCPVCGAEGASLSDCKGKDAEDRTENVEENTDRQEDTGLCKHHREHDDACGYLLESEDSEGSPCTYECRICPVEELIAALPDIADITEDNAEEVRAQLEEILALYRELTGEEQEQIDLSRCYALQEALDKAYAPMLTEVSIDYREASWNGSEVTYEDKTADCKAVESSIEEVEWDAGWYAVSGSVTISEPITVNGDVSLILADGCNLTAAKGIVVTTDNSLTIYAQSENGGTLTATGTTDSDNNASAGIGGSTASLDSGSITIHGGIINATGGCVERGSSGAGIGGASSSNGNGGSNGDVEIYGGVITATSGYSTTSSGVYYSSAGIGGGFGSESGGTGSSITIYGGKVTANSQSYYNSGAGIGGGAAEKKGGAGNSIAIYGGNITATSDNYDGSGGAGIGGGGGGGNGNKSGDGTVTISGGIVTAVGGEYAAGIGGGGGVQNDYFSINITGGIGSVTISGGIVDASSPTDVYYANYKGAPIGNGGNASGGSVEKTTGIVFENGVGTVCGDVTFDGSYAVPAGYSLHIPTGASLSGSGTLSGGGKFTTENLTEDMISVPADLYYNGQDRTEEIAGKVAIDGGITLCGQTFTVSGWTVEVEKTDDLHYTATYTNDSDTTKTFTKTITLQKSGTHFVGDGTVKTYKDGAECSDFTASDTITVKATPTATGQAPTKAAARLRGDPTAGQMVVFVGDTQVSAPADKGADGAYTMTVSAADVLVAAGGPGTGITLTAKFVGNDNMADGAGTVDVSISAAAKIEKGNSTTYVGESGLDAAFKDSGNSGAIFTLLKDVERTTYLSIDINCILDLGGHTITCTVGAVATYGNTNVTIQGAGEVVSASGTALDVGGNVTLKGGTFTSGGLQSAGVNVNDGSGFLSVTDEKVTIQNTGGGYGLAVSNAQSVQLSGGKYSGGTAAITIVSQSSPLTLGGLLGHSGDTRYAYFDGSTPIGGLLDKKETTTSPVTVKRCEHDKSVCAYTPNGDADTHTMTCRACGLEGAVEDCQLTYTSNETQHTAACETCGRSRTEAHSYGSWEPQHNGTAVTIRRVCESCKYTKTDGTFTVPAPGQTMQYGTPITLTCTSTLPGATFQWILMSFADISSTVQQSTGASFTPSETLAVGEYRWEAHVNWSGSDGETMPKSGLLSVTPAPLPDGTLSPASAVYDGTEQKPIVTIAGLTEGTDYTVSYTGDFTKAGEHTATVTGKGNYEGTVTKTFTIEKAEQTDFAFAAVTKPYEKNGTFTLSTTVGGGDGAVLYRVPENNGVLMVNGDKATIIGVGTVAVTATKAESENYKAATATGTIRITKAPAPAITYPAVGSITYGQKLSDCALTGGSTEYGTFAWENGSTIPAVDNTGYTVVFTASEETKKNYETITNTTKSVSVKVEKAVPAVSVTAAVSGSKDNRQAVITVNVAKAGAGAFPTGTVTFIDCTDGTEIGTATLTGGSATCTWEGLQDKEYTVRAVYAGNNNYTEAESRELTFDAAKQDQQGFALDEIEAKTYGDAAITLKTTGGNGSGAVRYESSDENVVRIEDGRAVITGAGTATITAIKAGDDRYNEASASRNVTVAKKALTVRADSKTVVRGNPMPAFTYQADGLVNGDTFTAAPSITAGAQDTDTLGKYDIVISGGTLQNSESYSITYVNGTLNIVERFYTVTVTDGTGSGEYAEGDTVTVTADERNGYTFTGWSSGDGVTFADSKAKTTTFTMPAKAVAVKANYTRNSSENNGGGSGDGGNSGGSGDNGGTGGNSGSGGNSDDNGNNGGGENSGGQGSGSTGPGNGTTAPQISAIPSAGTGSAPGNGAAPGTGTTLANSGKGNAAKPGTSLGSGAGTPAGTKQPFIKGADGKIGWDVIRAEEEKAQEGSVINVDMNGSVVVPGDIFDSIRGKDITITFDMGNGILWSVDGKSITTDKAGDIDFSVKTGVNTVPVDIVNNVTGESYSIQISLAYEGEFGFTAVLSIGLGRENAGLTASLYYYNESTKELEFICKDRIAQDGTASLTFTHASDYVITIDAEQEEGNSSSAEGTAPETGEGESALTGRAVGGAGQESRGGKAWPLIVAAGAVTAGIAIYLWYRKKKRKEGEEQP